MIILLSIVLGALWRRWLGLANTGPRAIKIAAGIMLMWPLVIAFWGQPWFYLAPGILLAYAAAVLFFVWKVDSAKPWPRYLVFGLGYVLAYRYWRDDWNRPPFIDGTTAIGELTLGGTFWGSVALLASI